MKANHLFVAAFAGLMLVAQAPQAHSPQVAHDLLEKEKQSTQIYKAYFPDLVTARKAAITFHDHLLESQYAAGYLVMELEAADMDRLRPFGFRFEHATEFIRKRDEFLTQMQKLQSQRLPTPPAGSDSRPGKPGVTASATTSTSAVAAAATVQTIPNYSCYETVEGTFAEIQNFVAARPNLASIVDAGDSWEKTRGLGGFDIAVLKLTNSATNMVNGVNVVKPKLFVNSAIHAREYTTAPLALEFARWLVNGYGVNADATWILDHHEVHLMLHTNPDGRKKAELGLSWRKNTNNDYCTNKNTRGADLNRNFTFSWNSTGGQGSSGRTCDLTYRGPSAGSEPETKAMESYVRSLWPDRRGPLPTDAAPADTSGIHLDLHSYSQLVLWPWGTTATPAPNGTALQTLGRKFAWFNGYTPQQSVGLYPTDGTSDGPSYGELGVAAFTVELGTSFFESCTEYNNNIKPKNLELLIYAAKVVRTPYITPAGPDVTAITLSGDASGGGVLPGTVVTLTASATDTRFNNSNGAEPVQSIAAAEAYINVPPWQAGAVSIPLAASDGSFNATTEGLVGSLNTSILPPGRHIVYLRAQDASGAWGAVSAVFLTVTNTPAPLAAAFSYSCVNLSCSFNGSTSTGGPTSYSWVFGDGGSGSGATTTRTYASAGTYSVTLTVGNGSTTASQTQSLTVTVPAPTQVSGIDNNNTLSKAQFVSPNPALVSATIGTSTDLDYYRVSLAAGRTLTATLTPNATSNYDLAIYNASGALVASSTKGTGLVDVASSAPNSGSAAVTVYVRVNWVGGLTGATGTYTLRLEQ
ncbi:MAG: M14 family zinc carboxypeptidase [Burkholderiales bacterium]